MSQDTTGTERKLAWYTKCEALSIVRSRLDMMEDNTIIIDPMILWALCTVKPIYKRGRELYTIDGDWFDWYLAMRDDIKISRKWGWQDDKGAYSLSFKP